MACVAYRGTAYVVFEELRLERYGNRLPQLSFEVFRPLAEPDTAEGLVRAGTLILASGEFAYAGVAAPILAVISGSGPWLSSPGCQRQVTPARSITSPSAQMRPMPVIGPSQSATAKEAN